MLGISSDPVESHADFASAERLPFRLLSDPDGAVRVAYGVPDSLFFLPGRVSFVIGRDRVVREVYQAQVDFAGHAAVACDAVEQLGS